MSRSSIPIEAIRAPGRAVRPLAAARPSCIVLGCVALIITMLLLVLPRPASAQAVPGEATLSTTGGYARLMLRFPMEVEAKVRLTGSVLVIQFKRPVDVAVDRINAGATDYIGAARRDPDGRALRFALARKVRVNTVPVGDRLFVDLLPESWTAAPPPLPQELVEELARRARDAERAARQQGELMQQRKIPPIRVRVANQPTFTRYVFEMSELTGVSTERGKEALTVSFAAPLRFDLADAKLSSPAVVGSVDATLARETASVKFTFANAVDVRTFREEFNYVVDITPLQAPAPRAAVKPNPQPPRAAAAGPLAGVDAPETVPAKSATETDAARDALAIAQLAGRAAPPESAPVVSPAAATPSPAAVRVPIVAAPPPVKAMPAADALPADAGESAPPPPAPATQLAAESKPATISAPPSRDAGRPVVAEVRRQGDNLRMVFGFSEPTPAAMFQRADTLWLVFDTAAKIDIAAVEVENTRSVRSVTVTRMGEAQVVRVKLERPRLASVVADKSMWLVTLGDTVAEPAKPLTYGRNVDNLAQSGLNIAFDDPRRVHRMKDPDAGDTLVVVTGLGPSRGFLRSYDFVEFRILPSSHGVAVQPHADDVKAELAPDKVALSRPGGLTLSDMMQVGRSVTMSGAATFNPQLWDEDRAGDFNRRQLELIDAAAAAPRDKRTVPRIDLARFYLARQMVVEAKSVLDVTIADEKPTAESPTALMLRGLCNILLDRIEPALKDLTNPRVGNQRDTHLWRALAYAKQGKWAEARDNFRRGEAAVSRLPADLQRLALTEDLRTAIEVGDFEAATGRVNDIETVGVTPAWEPTMAVLTGRLAQAMGRTEQALASFRLAAGSDERPAAAQARLREIALRYKLGGIKRSDLINELEVLTAGWRGDDTEVEALRLLAHLYVEEERHRDAFQVMRTALLSHPNADQTRRIQDEAAQSFDSLFLTGRGDTLPAIDALSLFYDFRDLTPIGRRGDEMIRRLADRLILIDLLDQAAELLQYQVDNRLQGAARAQVANKLAVVYLLSRRPDKAQAALRATRTADLSNEVRNQRLLIEARALSDSGRHDLALEVVVGIEGPTAIRLRADIHWAAQRWQQAAEQLELLYASRSEGFDPLNDLERSDILRSAIGYALADDTIGVGRLQEKFGAKMADSADRHAFEVVTAGLGISSVEFGEAARRVAAVDTLDGFLRDLHTRYPEMTTLSAVTPGQPASGPPTPAKASRETTGSIPRAALRASAR